MALGSSWRFLCYPLELSRRTNKTIRRMSKTISLPTETMDVAN